MTTQTPYLLSREAAARRLWELQEGRCGICHCPVTLEEGELDHILPLSRGSTLSWIDDLMNRQLVHKKCNREKHTKAAICRYDLPNAAPMPSQLAAVLSRPCQCGYPYDGLVDICAQRALEKDPTLAGRFEWEFTNICPSCHCTTNGMGLVTTPSEEPDARYHSDCYRQGSYWLRRQN